MSILTSSACCLRDSDSDKNHNKILDVLQRAANVLSEQKNNLKVKLPFHYSPHRRYVACLDSVFVIFNTETGCAGKEAEIIQLDSFPDTATKNFLWMYSTKTVKHNFLRMQQ